MTSLCNSQFPAQLLCKDILSKLPSGIDMRPLELDDYQKGYLETLAELTTVGNVTKEMFENRFKLMQDRNDQYMCVVLYDCSTKRVVGSANLLLEHKFIHDCGLTGHIEDVVISESQRGKGLGKWLIKQLVHLGKTKGAYKTLLACADKNVEFYEKCGLERKEISMAIYYH
ncbi:Glucosamine-phosphate N-acetyltransferase-like protein [Batrachochytrium dendrobatidis]|nr:Glucosamine-phosphate N-acetyltransferase-like protein [Batrachochytrium dendrobatidis]